MHSRLMVYQSECPCVLAAFRWLSYASDTFSRVSSQAFLMVLSVRILSTEIAVLLIVALATGLESDCICRWVWSALSRCSISNLIHFCDYEIGCLRLFRWAALIPTHALFWRDTHIPLNRAIALLLCLVNTLWAVDCATLIIFGITGAFSVTRCTLLSLNRSTVPKQVLSTLEKILLVTIPRAQEDNLSVLSIYLSISLLLLVH